MKFTHKIMTASILAASASTINAAPMYFNTGINIDGNIASPFIASDADSKTTFNEFNNFNPQATSVYTERAAGSDGVLKNNEILDFTDNGTVLISSLEDQFGNTLNGATTSLEGFNSSWNIEMVYSVSGFSTAQIGADINMGTIPLGTIFGPGQGLVPTFLTGKIEFKYNVLVAGALFNIPGLADGDKVLELDLVNGQPDIANLVLDGTVDYSWFTDIGDAKSTSIKNMFNFVSPVLGKNSFYDIWEAGDIQVPKLATVLWDVSTNVDPNLVPRSGAVGNYEIGGTIPTDACVPGTFCRTTGLNLDVQFNPVPEPSTLLLLGVGIIGFSYSASRKAKA